MSENSCAATWRLAAAFSRATVAVCGEEESLKHRLNRIARLERQHVGLPAVRCDRDDGRRWFPLAEGSDGTIR
jgi:hypothetical protein